MAVKTVIPGIFTYAGGRVLCNEERLFVKDLLISLTNQEFADKVEDCFHKMNNVDRLLSHAVAYQMDYSNSFTKTEPIIYVCLGNHIYSQIFMYFTETGVYKRDTIFQAYFEQIVYPFLSEIS
jgi:hypothetical protein